MNLKFWKKKTGAVENVEESQETAEVVGKPADAESTEPVTPEKPGLAARIRAGLTAVTMRFRKAPAPDDSEIEGAEADTHPAMGAPEGDVEDTPDSVPRRPSRKRLIIGGAIGTLALLLTAFGFVAWKIMLPPSEPEGSNPADAGISHNIRPASQAGTQHSEISALKEKNAELQLQLDTLKKEQGQPQSSSLPGQFAAGNALSSTSSGEISISNKDPKAAAAALKEAIEAMNAGSGEHPKKTDP